MRVDDVYQALRALDLPAHVLDWDVKSGADATGDEAVWVWVTLQDEDLTDLNRGEIRDRVDTAVRGLVEDHPPWVYVRFRSQSEQAAAG